MRDFLQKNIKKRAIQERCRGAVAIFLAILMLPFVSIAGALINAARINSAQSVFYEAMSNASDSTLASWDVFLKNRFGLLSMKQGDSEEATTSKIKGTFDKYLELNTKSLSNTYLDVDCECSGIYPLADKDILLNQVLEYSKYTIPTKLAVEGLDLDSIIKKLESLIPGYDWLNVISGAVGFSSSVVDLSNASSLLQDNVGETTTARNNYSGSYQDLEDKLIALAGKVAERNDLEKQLGEKNTEIDTQSGELERINRELDRLGGQWSAYNSLLTNLNTLNESGVGSLSVLTAEQKEQLDPDNLLSGVDYQGQNDVETCIGITEVLLGDLETAIDQNTLTFGSVNSEVTRLNNERDTLQRRVDACNTEIDDLRSDANELKGKYVEKTGKVIEKLNEQRERVKSFLDNVEALITSLGKAVTAGISLSTQQDIDKMNKLKEQVEADAKNAETCYYLNLISEEEYLEAIGSDNLHSQLFSIGTQNDEITEKYNKAIGGSNAQIRAACSSLEPYNKEHYNSLIDKLKECEKVEQFQVETVGESFSAPGFRNVYYKEITDTDLLTQETVQQAEKQIVGALLKSSVMKAIKALIGVLKNMVKLLLPADFILNSKIDQNAIEAGWADLATGNTQDKEMAEQFRTLFGSYSATDLNADDDFSLIDCIIDLFTNLNNLCLEANYLSATVGLSLLGGALQRIESDITNIKNDFVDLITFFGNSKLYEKVLLSGYLSYNTSCRTTYKGTALTGASFSLKSKDADYTGNVESLDSLSGLVNLIRNAIDDGGNVDSGLCFVGAETEFLICGRNSEIANQILTWLMLFGIRLICNIFPVIKDPEIISISSAATVASPIVFIVYIVLESLIDTAILTNGGSMDIFKAKPLLAPTNLSKLIKKLAGVSLTENQTIDALKEYEAAVVDVFKAEDPMGKPAYNINTDYSYLDSENKPRKAFGDLNYQNYLMIVMMLCSQQKLMNRFRIIVQTEARQYYKNDMDFDLSRSFTYLRAQAKYKTNGFIHFSDDENSYENVLIYRGY